MIVNGLTVLLVIVAGCAIAAVVIIARFLHVYLADDREDRGLSAHDQETLRLLPAMRAEDTGGLRKLHTPGLMPGAGPSKTHPVTTATCHGADMPPKVDSPASEDVPGRALPGSPIPVGESAPASAGAGAAHPAGDPDSGAAEPAATAAPEPPGPVHAGPPAGPGDPTWQAALNAIGDYEEHVADRAYADAAARGTGTLPISDKDFPHLAEGQYGHWHWKSDDSIAMDLRELQQALKDGA